MTDPKDNASESTDHDEIDLEHIMEFIRNEQAFGMPI